jgi:hypothetical protein
MSTRTGKGKKRKRIGRLRDKGQSARFIREAKKMGLDTDPDAFLRAMNELLGKKPKGGSS